jgi:HEPN domain-containing protein
MNVDYDIAQWIKLAETDLGIARHLFETYRPIPLEAICNHCQQSAEKIIKGYLFSKNIAAPKTHDVRELCEMCGEMESGFNNFNKEASVLTRYAVLPRYPKEFELEKHDAETAIKYADKIIEFVNGLLFPPTEDVHETIKENPADV